MSTARKPRLAIPAERIAASIYLLRGSKVIFDFDLADLYAVETKVLNQSVNRNLERFPEDFMFRISPDEWADIANRSQIVTGSMKHRDRRFAPRAFTQEGVAMLSGILRSKRAIEVNIHIMRTFIRLRETQSLTAELARKVEQHDQEIGILFEQVQTLLEPPAIEESKKRPIGFAPSLMPAQTSNAKTNGRGTRTAVDKTAKRAARKTA